jgi:hypothetical protein
MKSFSVFFACAVLVVPGISFCESTQAVDNSCAKNETKVMMECSGIYADFSMEKSGEQADIARRASVRGGKWDCEHGKHGRFFGVLDATMATPGFSQGCVQHDELPERDRFICASSVPCYCCVQSTGSVSGVTP